MPYIIAILVIVAVGVGFTLFQKDKTETPVVTPNTQELVTNEPAPEANPSTDTETEATTDYKDGTYETQVTYLTPVRDEYLLDVSLTLQNDIITGAKVVYSQGAEKDPNPQRFEAAYKAQIIGKNIDTLNLSRVGGASLTTAAFNNALADIKADAKS